MPVIAQDEDSQAILSLLQCTNSRLGLSGSTGGVPGGDGTNGAPAAGDSGAGGGAGGGGRRRARDEYSGELDAQEVANGFGMGMSSKVCPTVMSFRAATNALLLFTWLAVSLWWIKSPRLQGGTHARITSGSNKLATLLAQRNLAQGATWGGVDERGGGRVGAVPFRRFRTQAVLYLFQERAAALSSTSSQRPTPWRVLPSLSNLTSHAPPDTVIVVLPFLSFSLSLPFRFPSLSSALVVFPPPIWI